MEAIVEQVPQVEVEAEAEKAWLTREEKEKLVRDFEAVGGTIEDFVASRGISHWTMRRYIKQVGGSAKRKRAAKMERTAQIEEVNALIAGGMAQGAALRKVGITYAKWDYHQNKRHSKSLAKKYAPRAVKEAPDVSEDSFNKSLRARIASLESLVVELSLDRQALIEAREGAR